MPATPAPVRRDRSTTALLREAEVEDMEATEVMEELVEVMGRITATAVLR